MKKKVAPRYVDVNLVKEALLGWDEDPSDEDLEYAIDNIPIANVKEEKHGKWIDTDRFDFHKTPIYQCSECKKEVADNYINLHKFCLHCGTNMDGGSL